MTLASSGRCRPPERRDDLPRGERRRPGRQVSITPSSTSSRGRGAAASSGTRTFRPGPIPTTARSRSGSTSTAAGRNRGRSPWCGAATSGSSTACTTRTAPSRCGSPPKKRLDRGGDGGRSGGSTGDGGAARLPHHSRLAPERLGTGSPAAARGLFERRLLLLYAEPDPESPPRRDCARAAGPGRELRRPSLRAAAGLGARGIRRAVEAPARRPSGPRPTGSAVSD